MARITCATWWDPGQYSFPTHPKSVPGTTNIGDTNGEESELPFHYRKTSEALHGLLYVPLKTKLLQLLIYYHSGRNTTGKLEWFLTSHGIPSGKLASGPTDICIIRDYILDLESILAFCPFKLPQRWGTAINSDSINKPATCNAEQLKFWHSAQLPCSFPRVSDHILLSTETATLEKASGANFFRIQYYLKFRPSISPDTTLQQAAQSHGITFMCL